MKKDIRGHLANRKKEAAQRAKEQRLQAEGRRMMPLLIGKITPNGIYLGEVEIKTKTMTKKFNVFAAPHDLKEELPYLQATQKVARLKDAFGFKGEAYVCERTFWEAVEKGKYKGGWVVPGYDIMNKMLDMRHDGALAGTFNEKANYWTSSSVNPDESRDFFFVARLGDIKITSQAPTSDDERECRIRPVRFIEAE